MRKALRVTLRVVIIAAIVIAAGLLIAQDQEVLRVQSGLPAGDPGFGDYAGALVGTRASRGNHYEVLRNGDAIFPPMLDAIRQARHRISFETFIYSAGEVSKAFTEAFAAAAERGVQVQMVIDAVGGADMDPAHVDALQAAGVKIGWFNRVAWYSLEELNYRTHRKILVVDGEIGFTGGASLADHWLGHAQDRDHWRDTQFRITGPAVRQLEAGFYENWIETGGTVKPLLEQELPFVDASTRTIVINSSPSDGASGMKLLYLVSIAAAQKTLDIASPYFVLDESTDWAIAEAMRRGVRVRVLTEGDLTDAVPVKHASRDAYDRLLERGIEIHEYEPTMMHTKVMVVDGVWSIFGSANFDNRSLELNDELNFAVGDLELAAALTRDFEADLARSHRLTLDRWRQRSVLDKARERFWSLFGEVF